MEIEKKLRDFTLKAEIVAENEIVVLLGPSGSGKSTVLKCLAGLLAPDRGEIALDDTKMYSSSQDIDLKARVRRIGYVPQEYALFPHLTVERNICYGLESTHAQRKNTSRADELLEIMRIEHLKERFPRQLSGGEKQRVAMARALITKPALLLLDEPFSALDEKIRFEVQSELYELQKTWGIPFLLVTHDKREVDRLGAGQARLTMTDGVNEFCYSEDMRPAAPSFLMSY